MSQTYDGYRVDQDPNARYWASAICGDEELGDHLPGAADQRDVLLRLGRAGRWTCVTCGAAPCPTCAA